MGLWSRISHWLLSLADNWGEWLSETWLTCSQSNGGAIRLIRRVFYGFPATPGAAMKAREALEFIGEATSSSGGAATRRPFFALIAPPACHSPFTPAPRHATRFGGRRAPRWPSFDRPPAKGQKHWLLRRGPAHTSLPRDVIKRIDHVFRQRWRTLLSVDDMVIHS